MGALDGKHIIIQAPARSGSLYQNYKGTFSLNLMALVDANYKFTYVDIGEYGSNADGAVFKNSEFGQAFMNGDLDIPEPEHLPNYPASGPTAYCFVADKAFQLCVDLMRLYPTGGRSLSEAELIFNYRLSRAQCIVENSFGILAQRFRVFAHRLHLIPDNVNRVVKACCVLHNILRSTADIHHLHHQLNPDSQPFLQDDGVILAIDRLHGYHSSQVAKAIRELYKNYFMTPEGRVPWQARAVGH